MSAQLTVRDKSWSRIVAKAWIDAAFKDRLLSDPRTVLFEHGVETEGEVRVVDAEDGRPALSSDGFYLVLPPPPAELSEEQLLPTGVAFCGCGGCHRCGRCGCGCGGCGGCGLCGLCAVP